MPKVHLPSEFGAITLHVGALEAPHYADHKPERNFRACLGEGKVNGKAWGRIEYSFKTDGWNDADGMPRLVYRDFSTYTYSDPTNYQRMVMTPKGLSRVRNAIEAAVKAFLTTEAFKDLTASAEAEQRAAIKASAAAKVTRLQARIAEIEALVADVDTVEKPEEVERKLDALWHKYL